MGGEKVPAGLFGRQGRGSPPHGRGKDKWGVSIEDAGRITPAWAGKSYRLGYLAGKAEDHPRVCGEKTKKIP